MCDPSAIMMAASAVVGHMEADAAADAQDAQYEQNRLNSLAIMRDEYIASQNRQAQEGDAAGQRKQSIRMDARREESTARVAAGEAGVTGFSVDSLLKDISALGSRDITTIDQNKDWRVEQLNQEMTGIHHTAKSRINSVSRGTPPSMLGTALQIGNATADAYIKKKEREGTPHTESVTDEDNKPTNNSSQSRSQRRNQQFTSRTRRLP